ncbi:hypothetical protein JCM17960_06010 [Magnetospira thiophila]
MIQTRPKQEFGTRIKVGNGTAISWSAIQKGQRLQLQDVDCLLAMGNSEMRRTLHAVLTREGVGRIVETWDQATTLGQLSLTSPDLIIIDRAITETIQGTARIVRQLRHAEAGGNPYALVLALMDEPSSEEVLAWVNAGVDDLLAHPISPAQLLDRLSLQIESRKPFVVTSDYLGPERRNRNRPGDSKVESIVVPNSFAAKARGRFNASRHAADISTMVSRLNTCRMERHAERTIQMFRILRPLLEKQEDNSLRSSRLHQMGLLLLDMGRHLRRTPYAKMSDLCGSLYKTVQRLSDGIPDLRDVQALEQTLGKFAAVFELKLNEEVTFSRAAAE